MKHLRNLALLAGTVILLLLPQFTNDPYLLSILTMANLFAIFAAGWDLVSGYTGQLNLGQALFIGVGGYTVSFLAPSWGPWMAVIAGGLISAVIAAVVGLPSLRLKGPFLTLTTLVFPLIAERLAYTFRSVTGGEYGKTVSRPVDPETFYYITVIVMALSLFALLLATSSRYGKILIAIREDELAASAAGNDVATYKLSAFMLNALLAGIGGGLMAFYLRNVSPGMFSMNISNSVAIMGIIGGMGSILGPALAGYILTISNQFLRELKEYQDLVYALLLIVSVMFFPKGFAGLSGLLFSQFKRRGKKDDGALPGGKPNQSFWPSRSSQ